MIKKCNKCSLDKNHNDFSKDKYKKDGLSTICKQCKKDYKKQNQEKIKKYSISYYHENLEKFKKLNKEYKIKNKDKMNEYYRNKRKNDINYKISCNLRCRLRHAIKKGKYYSKKIKSTLELLGCDLLFLKSYLESMFTDNMSWENYGEWHIDHIIPCISFDLSIKEQQEKCFHYSNLQPLWAKDNLKKGKKVNIFDNRL